MIHVVSLSTMSKTIGAKIEYLRTLRDITQEELAARIGLAGRQSRISLWIKGTGYPPPAIIWRLAEALGTTTDYLCNPDATDPELRPEPPSERYKLAWELVERLDPEEAVRRLMDAPRRMPDETVQKKASEPEVKSPQARKPIRLRKPPKEEKAKDNHSEDES